MYTLVMVSTPVTHVDPLAGLLFGVGHCTVFLLPAVISTISEIEVR